MRLHGKVAIITGAASGMGLAMATRFAAEGARVVAADWNADRLEAAVRDITAAGGAAVGSHGDIAQQAAAEGLVPFLGHHHHLPAPAILAVGSAAIAGEAVLDGGLGGLHHMPLQPGQPALQRLLSGFRQAAPDRPVHRHGGDEPAQRQA